MEELTHKAYEERNVDFMKKIEKKLTHFRVQKN